MTVLKESPWYQEILKEGLEKGEKQGLQQGLQQEGVKLVSIMLKHRFETIKPSLQAQINQLATPDLEKLAEALLDFKEIDDLEQWLQGNS